MSSLSADAHASVPKGSPAVSTNIWKRMEQAACFVLNFKHFLKGTFCKFWKAAMNGYQENTLSNILLCLSS